ncbi:PhzF family phenazine biosynthesis protein [Deinococcus sp.]|uniref:PhzF family phenazine biosynthesis protein n=1 Tax=Deinococcus sp. TaxID=47478 RepID=UPI003CC6110C
MMTPLPYRVYAAPRTKGGKLVSVFPSADSDLQALAAAAGTPLSVFVQYFNVEDVVLKVFTPEREKGESDSAAIAALHFMFSAGQVIDVTNVHMNGQEYAAQLCGGEWLLKQGDVSVWDAPGADFSILGFTPEHVQIASTGRPNLLLEVANLATLKNLTPDSEQIKHLNHASGTTGLILYTLEAPRADVSFRAFGPLKGFYEDAASSNMFACLVGALSVRGLLPPNEPLVRGLQWMPGLPSRLTAQYLPQPGSISDVWVGGNAALIESVGLDE